MPHLICFFKFYAFDINRLTTRNQMTSIYEYFFINWHRYQFHFVYVWIRTNFCFFFTFNLKLFIKMAINSKLQCMLIPMDFFHRYFCYSQNENHTYDIIDNSIGIHMFFSYSYLKFNFNFI